MTEPAPTWSGRNLFEAIVEEVGVGVALYDERGRFRYVNPAYAGMLGYERDELVGRSVWDVNPDVDPDRFDGYWASFERGETKTSETRHRAVDGETFPVETVTTRIDEGDDAYNVGTIKDATARREHERELERRNERLEQFASVVSHDLRNPLNVVAGRLDLFRDDGDEDHLEAAQRAVDRMEAIIDDLLTLARADDEIEAAETIVIEEIAGRAWETVDAGADLVIEDARLEGDRTKIQTVLENLFRNAVDHGGEDVTVAVGPTDGGFYVADDGPGIPEADRERVFEWGYTTADDGTGFGLAIVERIVGAHGWSIDVTTSEDGGARFEIGE